MKKELDKELYPEYVYPEFTPDPDEAFREPIAKLGKKITDRIPQKLGLKKITRNDPEYWGLAGVLTDEEAELALKLGVRKSKTLAQIVKLSGMEEKACEAMLEEMSRKGLLEYNWENEKHEKQYVLPMYVPGCSEIFNMNAGLLESNPEMGTFFEHISRLTHGEGCADDPEGWCIAVDDMADYVVETQKDGRYITREEALEILKAAEDNGFVHQITNIDGADKIFAICNCNVNVCYALRTSQLFNTPNMSRSAYVAKVEKANCVACGKCVEVCPAHVAVQGYLKLAKEGRYEEALVLIKKDNPLPAVCGHVCNRRCEDACTRGTIDEAVAIDEVKRFLAERDLKTETRYIPKKTVPSLKGGFEEKIAVIGAGPAGLSCAYYLALEEGIQLNCGWGPREVLEENGKATAVVFKKCTRVLDEQGRFSPEYDEEETITVPCKHVLFSVGQAIDWGNMLDNLDLKRRPNGGALANRLTYQTSEPDIFVGGDVYTGPKFAIDAIAAGREGAISLHRYVHENCTLTIGRNRRDFVELDKENISIDSYDTSKR